MAIQKRKDDNRVELILDGWIDTLGAPMLASELDALESDVEHLTLEMAGLEYCSSAGIRQIVAAQKRMKGSLTLRNVNERIKTLLRMAGLASHLNFEP